MGMLLALMSCLGSLYPESNPAYSGGKIGYKTQEERDIHIHRVIGCAPAIAAACLRIFNGQPIVKPDPSCGYIQNFMKMAFGRPSLYVHKGSRSDSRSISSLLSSDPFGEGLLKYEYSE